MIVLLLTAVKPGLRGELSRWFIEPRAGVFVGNAPARVRDRLWLKVKKDLSDGSAVMICSARTEQGFSVFTHGDHDRMPVDFEGLVLIRRKLEKRTDAP